MEKTSRRKAHRILTPTLLLFLLILTFLSNLSLVKIAKAQSAVLKVDPSSITVGNEGEPITEQNITLTIKVEDVENLATWQIVVYYDDSILRTKATYLTLPLGHVFYGKGFSDMPTTLGKDANGAYIMKSISLYGDETGFYGDGVICEIIFTTVGNPGTSPILFSKPIGSVTGTYDTYFWDKDFNDIYANCVEGSVTVKGIPPGAKEPSIITIATSSPTVYMGDNVTISGNVTKQDGTPKPNVSVDIFKRMSTEPPDAYSQIATVTTNETGAYTYVWVPHETDIELGLIEETYTFKASWDGDIDTYGDESDEINITVIRPWITLFFEGERVFGVEKKPEELPKTFTINLTANFEVETEIYSWQVKLLYDATYLEFINASLPQNHIFQNNSFTWWYQNSTAEKYLLINATLENPSEQVSVVGNVTLCALTLNATRTTRGTTAKIIFDRTQTLLANATGFFWPYSATDYEASIYGKETIVKVESILTIEVVPDRILIKESATIRGTLTMGNGTAINGTIITVSYQSDDKMIKGTMTNKTDDEGNYVILFTATNEPYEFTFSASWKGTEYIYSNSSKTVKLVVTERGAFTSDVWYYPTIAAVFVIIAVNIAVTVLYIRRPKEEMPKEKPFSS